VEVPLGLAALRGSLMPGVDEAGALLQGIATERFDREIARERAFWGSVLREPDPVGARALLARLDFEADPLAAGE
jgi:hypothetical protein